MAFLLEKDYDVILSKKHLDQITTTPTLKVSEGIAIEEIYGLIGQRYDLAYEMRSIEPYSPIATYYAGNRVIDNDSIYEVIYPNKLFSFGKIYQKGEVVCYEKNRYQALQLSEGIEPTNPTFWGDLGVYEVTEPLTDTTKWVKADTRNPMLVYCVCCIAVANLKRIAPVNVPEWVLQTAEKQNNWLKKLRDGEIISNMRQKEAPQGRRILFSSGLINQNTIY